MFEAIRNYFSGALDTIKTYFSDRLHDAQEYITDHINQIQYGFRHYLLIFLTILFIYIINKYQFLSKKLVVLLSWIATFLLFFQSIHNFDNSYAINNISIVELLGLLFVLFLAIMNTFDLFFNKNNDVKKPFKIKIKKENEVSSNVVLAPDESIITTLNCNKAIYTFTNKRFNILNTKSHEETNIPYSNIVEVKSNVKDKTLQLFTSINQYDVTLLNDTSLKDITNAIAHAS